MAITGSQKAYLQARAGIGRSGAIRSGYFLQNVVVTITHPFTQVPTDITAHIKHNGWSISMNLNDDIDTATVSLLPSLPFVPATRSQIRISFGSADNVQFAGIVLIVQRTREPGPAARVWTELQCVDWTALLDAQLVLADYPAQSATATILALVGLYTPATGISTAGVPAGLPTIPGAQIISERPSTVLRRIANQIGGGFYLDARRVLRFWSAAVPSPIQESSPVPLTDNLATLKTFRVTTDASQQRTRVFVEGRRTSTLLGSAPTASGASVLAPIGDATAIHLDETYGITPSPAIHMTRVGTRYALAFEVFNPAVDASKNPLGTTTTQRIEPGATILWVVSTAGFPLNGFVQVADQVVPFGSNNPAYLVIPGAGLPGALLAPVDIGTQVVLLATVRYVEQDRFYNPAWPVEWHKTGAAVAQPYDVPVVLVSMKQHDQAANEIARQEGSSGYYEHLIQDGRYSSEGSTARADAELANFAYPLVAYEWETEDLNAEPGRMQHIALIQNWNITADVRITNVTVTPIATNAPPRRVVRAVKVQPALVTDVWVDDPQ